MVRTITNFACEYCSGTGDRLEEYACNGDKCFNCEASGNKHVNDWRAAYTVTSSPNLLFNVLDCCEDETSATEEQLVTLVMMADYGQHGSSLGGDFGIALMKYIRSVPFELKNIISNATEAMRTAHGQIWTLSEYDKYSIRTEIDGGAVGMTVPGDACGINTGFDSDDPENGCEFSCHNVDSPLQSLTLLAGIASMTGQIGYFISKKDGKVAIT